MTFEIDGFTPIAVIGRGGFGTVHRAADDAHGREVAVKVLGRITDDSARRRFDRERRAMGTLSGHPTIGIVYTSGFTANHEPYIVMEMIRGGSLADRLEKDGPLPVREVAELGATLAEALHHAHEGGVLHLDLKPENILMSRFGRPKIVDFGIAAIIDDDSATSTIRATPSYADPDVLEGKPGTERSDVYGLAATLYTLLVGSAPYSDGPDGLYRVMQRVALDPVPSVDRTDVSPQFAALLRRAMSKDPADRPESMEEFARLLRDIEPEPVTERRPSPRRVDRSDEPQRDRRRRATDAPIAAASDGWPGEGQRPRLPGPVDSSNPVLRPDPVPHRSPPIVPSQPVVSRTPTPGVDRVRENASPPSSAPAWTPSTAAPRHGAAGTPSTTPSRDWPQRRVAPAVAPVAAKRQRTTLVAVAVLATLAVILAAVLAFIVVRRDRGTDGADGATEPPTTADQPVSTVDVSALATDGSTVPDVIGLSVADARAVIAASGLDVAIPNHCFDTVVGQAPASGTAVDEERLVSVVFAPCVVPDFVGLRLPEARRIVDEEFVVGLLIDWPAHCDDLVLGQSVAAGTTVDPGTMVTLALEDDCSDR